MTLFFIHRIRDQMQRLNYINRMERKSQNQSDSAQEKKRFIDLENLRESFEALTKSWEEVYFKLDRIVFSNLSICRQFLEMLAGTSWQYWEREEEKELEQKNEICYTECQKELEQKIREYPIHNLEPPKIVCSLETSYDLDIICKRLIQTKSKDDPTPEIKTEILCGDSEEQKQELGYYIEDFLPEFPPEVHPYFSLVQSTYEINYNKIRGKKRRRKKKKGLPKEFQKRINKAKGDQIKKNILGKQYYGMEVFKNMMKIMFSMAKNPSTKTKRKGRLEMPKGRKKRRRAYSTEQRLAGTSNYKGGGSQGGGLNLRRGPQVVKDKKNPNEGLEKAFKKLPLPDYPLKYYDLQEEGEIELRFSKAIPARQFLLWLEALDHILEQNKSIMEDPIKMVRASVNYTSWNLKSRFRKAQYDRFFYTYNDFLFDFYQRNFEIIKLLTKKKASKNHESIYFQLTSAIDEEDFRIELLSDAFEGEMHTY